MESKPTKTKQSMIFDNAKPRLNEAITDANSSGESKELKFIYNELLSHDTIASVFNYLFRKGVDFTTRHDEYRFVVIVHPKIN